MAASGEVQAAVFIDQAGTQCNICFDEHVFSVRNACGHMLCFECLVNVYRHSHPRGSLQRVCPTCKGLSLCPFEYALEHWNLYLETLAAGAPERAVCTDIAPPNGPHATSSIADEQAGLTPCRECLRPVLRSQPCCGRPLCRTCWNEYRQQGSSRSRYILCMFCSARLVPTGSRLYAPAVVNAVGTSRVTGAQRFHPYATLARERGGAAASASRAVDDTTRLYEHLHALELSAARARRQSRQAELQREIIFREALSAEAELADMRAMAGRVEERYLRQMVGEASAGDMQVAGDNLRRMEAEDLALCQRLEQEIAALRERRNRARASVAQYSTR